MVGLGGGVGGDTATGHGKVGRKYPFQVAELKPMLLGPKAISTPLHSLLAVPLKPSPNKLQKLQSENC